MTHLNIQQSTSNIEEVTHSIIEKLYNIAVSSNLDSSSDIQGRLHTSATYTQYVQYLTTNYPNLYINSDDYYVPFEDPEIKRIFAQSNYGDGQNLFLSAVQNITDLNNVTISGTGKRFKGNNKIQHFNELQLFTHITSIGNECFKGCTKLVDVTLSNNVTGISDSAFRNCTKLASINISSNINLIDAYAFQGCSSLQLDASNLSGLLTLGQHAFDGCTKLSGIVNLPNLTQLGYDLFSGSAISKIYCNNCTESENFYDNCANLTRIEMRSYTGDFHVPLNTNSTCLCVLGNPRSISKVDDDTNVIIVILNGTSVATLDQYWAINSNFKAYVPDALVQSYKSATNWRNVANYIYPLSDWVDPEAQTQ